jgi:hypothetical protein
LLSLFPWLRGSRLSRRRRKTPSRPIKVKFGPAPPFRAPGTQLAVLEGNPMADSGDFTIRLKMPDGYKISPHTHPNRENVTVISGLSK